MKKTTIKNKEKVGKKKQKNLFGELVDAATEKQQIRVSKRSQRWAAQREHLRNQTTNLNLLTFPLEVRGCRR